jgi:hypothetical protein
LAPVKNLMQAMRESGRTTLSSIETQLLLRELYDNHFGIARHDNPARPLSLVALHPKETVGPYSRRDRVYRRFAALGVGDIFKISIKDFLEQPRELVELMFQIAEDKSVLEDRKNGDIQRSLDHALSGRSK